MIKVLVADDHPVVRRGIKDILAETSDIVATGEANNGQAVLDMVSKGNYDVILLDLTMPITNGEDVIKELRSLNRALPILILSIHAEKEFGVQMIKAGVAGYLTKERAPDDLIQAIRKVAAGGKYISPNLAEMLASELYSNTQQPSYEALSRREKQIFRLIASGEAEKNIASKLFLSVQTISTYKSRILVKLNLRNTAELIRYALQHHLLD